MVFKRCVVSLLATVFSLPVMAESVATAKKIETAVSVDTAPNNGKIEKRDEQLLAWDEGSKRWVSPKVFWLNYAQSRGGLTWEEGRDYPTYGEVKEHDTFMVLVDTGPCLMEFFHSRWRRANDVRRWDPAFNEYGGCPNVFD